MNTGSILNWIDLMERSLERRAPQPALAAAPVAAAAPKPAPVSQPEESSPALDLLRYLDRFEREHGQMPAYNQIAEQLQVKSPGHARYCVVSLENAGLVQLAAHVHRGISITPKGRAILEETAA